MSGQIEEPFVKGINYDVGTEFRPGDLSRAAWNRSDVARDMRVIREELKCTSVNVYGTELSRLGEAAAIALEQGLHVSFQPRVIDGDRGDGLELMNEAAALANDTGGKDDVTLNIGCEITLFTRGFIPGHTFRNRMRNLVLTWPLLGRISSKLNDYLTELANVARGQFEGPITYGAGSWERVDWAPFDLVGVNLYRNHWNEKTYQDDLVRLLENGKPVVITEFGCATFEGAERRGGGGWTIVDFDSDPIRVKPGHRRSERIQAELLGELLGLFKSAGVHGAYVFDFMGASFPHVADPRLDLDMASYGVVRVIPTPDERDSIAWERKESFGEVARRYGEW